MNEAFLALTDPERRGPARAGLNAAAKEDILVWQFVLGLTLDATWGDQTQSATSSWQESHDLEVDGIVGTNTWKAMRNAGADTKLVTALLATERSLAEETLARVMKKVRKKVGTTVNKINGKHAVPKSLERVPADSPELANAPDTAQIDFSDALAHQSEAVVKWVRRRIGLDENKGGRPSAEVLAALSLFGATGIYFAALRKKRRSVRTVTAR